MLVFVFEFDFVFVDELFDGEFSPGGGVSAHISDHDFFADIEDFEFEVGGGIDLLAFHLFPFG